MSKFWVDFCTVLSAFLSLVAADGGIWAAVAANGARARLAAVDALTVLGEGRVRLEEIERWRRDRNWLRMAEVLPAVLSSPRSIRGCSTMSAQRSRLDHVLTVGGELQDLLDGLIAQDETGSNLAVNTKVRTMQNELQDLLDVAKAWATGATHDA